mgnify:CR=1 FL=1
MGRFIETTITDFTGGVTTEARVKNNRFARAIKHFDILGSQEKLVPHRRFEADTFNSALGASVSADGVRITKFLTYGTSLSGTVMFGLGTGTNAAGDTTDNTPRLYYRSTTSILTHDNWLGDSAATGVLNENLFVEYNNIAYAARADEIIQWTLDVAAPLGSSAVASSHAITFTSIFQGLVHQKDNILYIPYLTSSGAFIMTNTNGAWSGASSDTALTLPVFVGKIDICEKGDFLGVAVQPKFVGGNSYVYLWDRNSSLATTSEKIDWGNENLELIEEIDGILFGISTQGANLSVNFSDSARVFIKYWDGTKLNTLLQLNCEDRTIAISQKQKANGRIYFMMSCKINGAWHEGVWSFGKNKQGQFALALEYQLNNDTQITSVALKGFKIVGDYIVIAYNDNGTYTLKVTDDDATYSDTSIWESVIFNAGDQSLKKDLKGVTVFSEPLPTAGSYTLKYKVDAETSWTTIFTESTDNSISHSAINIESSSAVLPKDYKEIQFRSESTGNAIITGFSFQEDITGKRLYQAIS